MPLSPAASVSNQAANKSQHLTLDRIRPHGFPASNLTDRAGVLSGLPIRVLQPTQKKLKTLKSISVPRIHNHSPLVVRICQISRSMRAIRERAPHTRGPCTAVMYSSRASSSSRSRERRRCAISSSQKSQAPELTTHSSLCKRTKTPQHGMFAGYNTSPHSKGFQTIKNAA